ncbi:MHYT domain-containing protein [Citrobacter sp. ANG330]|uniref:MHYT domain-containing protein n=1 Tax=Citrobacter sp. ANG330 TaxID=3048142 RepID=UPI0039C12E17
MVHVSWDPGLIGISFLIALFAASLAIHMSTSGNSLSRTRLFAATAVLSMGMVIMHYVGMAAIIGHGAIVWNQGLVALSVIIAVLASGIGLRLAFSQHRNMRQTLLNRLAASLMVALAISAMHYTGMGAATFSHHNPPLPAGLSQVELAVYVAGITLVTREGGRCHVSCEATGS